LTVFYTRTS